jgi:hypothetical protein
LSKRGQCCVGGLENNNVYLGNNKLGHNGAIARSTVNLSLDHEQLLLVADIFSSLFDFFVFGINLKLTVSTIIHPHVTHPYHFVVRFVESFSDQTFFFSLQCVQLGLNLWVNKVCNVLAIHDFRNAIVFPFRVGKKIVLLIVMLEANLVSPKTMLTSEIDIVNTGASILSFQILLKLGSLRILRIVCCLVFARFRNEWSANLSMALD